MVYIRIYIYIYMLGYMHILYIHILYMYIYIIYIIPSLVPTVRVSQDFFGSWRAEADAVAGLIQGLERWSYSRRKTKTYNLYKCPKINGELRLFHHTHLSFFMFFSFIEICWSFGYRYWLFQNISKVQCSKINISRKRHFFIVIVSSCATQRSNACVVAGGDTVLPWRFGWFTMRVPQFGRFRYQHPWLLEQSFGFPR